MNPGNPEKVRGMKTHGWHSEYTVIEEIYHAITHGLGVLLSIIGMAVLVAIAVLRGDITDVISVSIYGATLILLYTASTVYHAIPVPSARPWLQQLDHSAIYLLIAGTYTPFALITLQGAWGWTILAIVWTMAVIGVTVKMARIPHSNRLSLVLYLVMGWVVIIAIKPLVENLETGGLVLLVLGGLAYTGGAYFYAKDSKPYFHAIWHLFVLAGSMLHYFAILFYVLPDGPAVVCV